MKDLWKRRVAGLAVLGIAVLVFVAMTLPALAAATKVGEDPGPGAVCPGTHLSPGTGTSGVWGSATSSSTGVNVTVTTGFIVTVCVKAGPGYELWEVTPPSGFVPSVDNKGLSHWALSWEEDDTPPTTEPPTTEPPTTEPPTTEPPTTEPPTTEPPTTEPPTTEPPTTEPPTTEPPTTEPSPSTTVQVGPTTTVQAESTTTTIEPEVEQETTSTTAAPTTTEETEDETDDTLPFTGIGTDGMAAAAALALAAGAGLVLLSTKGKEAGSHVR
ncbi:MAG TPA: hypothetical protein VHL52_12635 [Acidimicrobiia bacterium]|nr:hypothetical protein [Acidimicrobiia bacterium]